MSETMPFKCPFCGERFGTGADAALLSVTTSVAINGEPTPCCGKPFHGSMRRDGDRLSLVQAGVKP